MPNMPNGDSMSQPNSFTTCTGLTTSWKSTETEDTHTLDPQQQRTPDGGNYSELKVHTSESSRRMSTNTSMFKELSILKEDTFNVMKPRTERSINNGKLSTLIPGRVNPPREK